MTSAVTILQYPFRGDLAIQTNDWTAVIDHIQMTGPLTDMRM